MLGHSKSIFRVIADWGLILEQEVIKFDLRSVKRIMMLLVHLCQIISHLIKHQIRVRAQVHQ